MGTGIRANTRRVFGVIFAIASLATACGGSSAHDGSDADAAARQFAIGDRLEHGTGVVADLAGAREAYRASCDAGDMHGCAALAYALTVGPRLRRETDLAMDLARRACDAGDLLGCTNYAVAMTFLTSDERTPETELALHQRACDGGVLVGCRRVGAAYLDGEGVEVDYDRALAVFRDACDHHDGPSCTAEGELAEAGVGAAESRSAGLTLFLAGCDAGDGRGCQRAASVMLDAAPAGGDLGPALALLQRGCDFGAGSACSFLGNLLVEGTRVAPDHPAGADLLARGCAYGDGDACDGLGQVLVGNFGDAPQLERAVEAYGSGCDEELALACLHLGEMVATGRGIQANTDDAADLFELACEGGIERACDDAGADEHDLRAYESSCVDSQDLAACVEAGGRYEDGDGVDPNPDRAIELYRLACDEGRGSADGCTVLGYALDERGDLVEAMEAWQHACDDGAAEACIPIGEVYAVGGDGFPVDMARARALLFDACDRGAEEGCERFATVLASWAFEAELGDGGRPDRTRALALYDEGCRTDPSGTGCFQLARMRGVRDPALHTYRIALTQVEGGPSWLRVGQRCEIVVKANESDEYAFIRATCGGRPIYSTASEIALSEELSIEDSQTSEEDGDALLRVDLDAGTFQLEDGEEGALGEIQLEGRVTSAPR